MAPVEIKDDYYAALEVSHAATPEDIRKSYLRLAITRHPDKNPTDPGAKAAFQLVGPTPFKIDYYDYDLRQPLSRVKSCWLLMRR